MDTKTQNGKWITGYSTLNAIGEEMFDKRLFKDAALTKRCVILRMDFMNGDIFYPLNKKTRQPLKPH